MPASPLHMLVVDDHEAVLGGTVSAIQRAYPDAILHTERTAQAALAHLATGVPDVAVLDLHLPNQPGETASTDAGLRLLRALMQQYPTLNLVIQSANVKPLIRLKPAIDDHQGGFTIVDKSLPLADMLIRVDWALQGVNYTPRELRTGLTIKPEWLQVLRLAFQDGLQDKAIAEQMNVAERTVRHYWNKVQDALGVYPDPGKNIRIQTEIRAREEGLID